MSEKNFEEFFRGAEFGDYLEEFAEHFNLRERIQFSVELRHLERRNNKWKLLLAENGNEEHLMFDAVFLCTGLVNQKVPFGSTAIPISEDPESIRNATVVVIGGGVDCTVTVEFDVTNISTVDVTTDIGLLVVADQVPTSSNAIVGGLDAGQTLNVTIVSNPGGNCFDPDCSVQVTVDPSNAIPESNEANNSDNRIVLG